jgi:hypothetical protein
MGDRQLTQAELKALRDAMFSQNPGAGYQTIPVEGTPEEMAEALIKPSLPRAYFDQIDLSATIGMAQMLGMFVSRPPQASLEKDEIIRFVERNRPQMPEFFGKHLATFKKAAVAIGDVKLTEFIEYFAKQAHCAYLNTPDKIDVKSDRFLWLVYALAAQVDSGRLGYNSALDYLQKPVHYDRISELTLQFMLYDYAESVGKVSQTSLVYVMLIGEAARIKNIPKAAAAAFMVVIRSGRVDKPANMLHFINNLEPFLLRAGLFSDEDKAAARRIRSRFASDIKPSDF